MYDIYFDINDILTQIWHKSGLDEELNVLTLADDLELLLKELGAAFLSSRTLKFLSLDNNLRLSFAEQYRRIPLVKANALTAIAIIRRDSWNDPASSCLILGTEVGEVLVLDPRYFSCIIMKKFVYKIFHAYSVHILFNCHIELFQLWISINWNGHQQHLPVVAYGQVTVA